MMADTYNLKHKTRLYSPIKSILIKYTSVPYNYKVLSDLCLKKDIVKGVYTASFTIYSNLIKGNHLSINTHHILINTLETFNLFKNLDLFTKYNKNCFIISDPGCGKSVLTMHWARLVAKN